ncbi:hypothetical protein TNCV_4256031 [Trichonephila clavipes]|nr:hypothetical protein TNCV_4256031 [Trichonephila clavipes]
MPCRRIRAHYEQLSEFVTGRIFGLKEAGWVNRRKSLVILIEAMRPLEDAGKKGWTTTYFSTIIVAIDLRP